MQTVSVQKSLEAELLLVVEKILCVKRWIDYVELLLRYSHDQVESLWLKLGTRPIQDIWWTGSTAGHLTKRIPWMRSCLCYKRHHTHRVSFWWGISTTHICWESSTVICKVSKKLLESLENNFLVHVLNRLTRGEALLGLKLTSAEELNEENKTGGSLGCNKHALIEFVISRSIVLTKNRVRMLNFKGLIFKFSFNWSHSMICVVIPTQVYDSMNSCIYLLNFTRFPST